MLKEITINGQLLTYTLKRSSRAKRLRITVYRTGEVAVTLPLGITSASAERYIQEKGDWLREKITFFQKNSRKEVDTSWEFLRYKVEADHLVRDRLAYFNAFYGYCYKKITIRKQKGRWGSCSHTGNLSFNYRLALLPPEMADYIVVHELCHLKEFNHSANFWDLVALTIPNYKQIRKQLLALPL